MVNQSKVEQQAKAKQQALYDKLGSVPGSPGVYLMKGQGGEILYVGKARNLRKRLASYFKPPEANSGLHQQSMKTTVLIRKIVDFEVILTDSEKEALILESNLIKRHRPRYNVELKDDKRYPVLRLNIKDPYPTLTIVRKIQNDGALYFGPYTSAQAVRETLKIINKTFRLRKCRAQHPKKRTRPCLHCQMDGCLAPCCRDVDPRNYQDIVNEVVQFLKGRTPDLIDAFKARMEAAAEVQNFEQAAILRNKMFALQKTLEKQVLVSSDFVDRDIIGVASFGTAKLVMILFTRGGKLIGSRQFAFEETIAEDAELLRTFIYQYYEKQPFIPKEIIIPLALAEENLIEEWLREKKGAKVTLTAPQRGEKVRMLQMAVKNAENALKDWLVDKTANRDLLARLQRKLKLARFPTRIECFDNSNLAGAEPVAGMVVFENGQPRKQAYRKYKIKQVGEQNDYAYMQEVLTRRLGKGDESKPLPDLLMVDGGKGQLNIALAVLANLRLTDTFDVIGIAKKDDAKGELQDKIYRPGRSNPLILNRDPDVLLLLQRIRDEAHRFAITFQRSRRRKQSLRSSLDTIAGIGPKRKALLLKHFGSIAKIRRATVDQLNQVEGISKQMAETIHMSIARK